ncbi:hypothetical protein CJD36_003810 [Flavipsychrobacter stenotrophus]|uniref:Uncharacterized protein n=1 Tax=Flavipsychrobacter stenotrophus TaxID=2077091 RepID=A0A2S7T1Y5_9BACT|nr:hypothetical protein [Flavipsychrobacter stenotrophus]PQJ12881.1 hypothetical protein CJD36_003810 [Flavipsychrobacter stenotrophus]
MNLKKLLLGLLVITTLGSCSRFTQVVYVSPSSEDIHSVNHFYTYENEDIKVVYWFWAEHGVMSFLCWNKTNQPMYLDWKKSAMINNGKRMSYYTNKYASNYITYGDRYGLDWLDVFNEYYSTTNHVKISRESLVKGERVTFIPPKSYITQAFYNLTANIFFDVTDRNTEPEVINFCNVYVSRSKSDISFRNYLTYSFSEDNEAAERHVDNEFHLNKVVTMDNRYFEFKDLDGYRANDWERPSRFFIKELRWQDVYK